MNKIVNHTESYITGNNIAISNEDIWNIDLDLEELGTLFTLLAFIDEEYFTDDELFNCFKEPQEEVEKVFEKIIVKGYLEIIDNNGVTEYHVYGKEVVN